MYHVVKNKRQNNGPRIEITLNIKKKLFAMGQIETLSAVNIHKSKTMTYRNHYLILQFLGEIYLDCLLLLFLSCVFANSHKDLNPYRILYRPYAALRVFICCGVLDS